MKRILILIMGAMLLTACGSPETKAEEPKAVEKKDSITANETKDYLGELLDPFIETSSIKTEAEAFEAAEKIDEVSYEVKRELKRVYKQDITEVDDLIALADLLMRLATDIEEENTILMGAYSKDVGSHIYKIATEYLDGELPSNYAELVGADNLHDLRD